jgi:hypothetical protein
MTSRRVARWYAGVSPFKTHPNYHSDKITFMSLNMGVVKAPVGNSHQ